MRRIATAVAVAAATAGLPQLAGAQQWNIDLTGGQIRSALDPGTTAQSIALGLRYDDAVTGLRLSAGLPTEQAQPLWGSLGGWRRLAVRFDALTAGLDLAGNAFITRDRALQQDPIPGPLQPGAPSGDVFGYALAGQALPMVGYEGVDFEVHARAGVSTYLAEFDNASTTRTVQMADVQLTYAATQSLALMPVARYFRHASEPGMTYVGASAVFAQPHAAVWGSAGRFVDGVADDVNPSAYAAGVMLRVQRRLSLQASARRAGYDPLYLTPPQTSWSVGASLLVGGRAGPQPPPVPAAYEGGRATITLPVADAEGAPRIAGDFNDWSPAPMQRDGDHWSYTVPVEPGVYNYAFVAADGSWFVPQSVPGRKDDGMGGHVAVLVVE